MSRSLNHWVANVQATFTPQAIGFGTFHPDDAEALPGLVDEAFGKLGLFVRDDRRRRFLGKAWLREDVA